MASESGITLFQNTGTKTAPVFEKPLVLVPPSKKTSIDGPERPDSGIYMDVGDLEGDGDLDLLVGGYSHWSPKPPELTEEQKARVATLQAELAQLNEESRALGKTLTEAIKGLDAEAAKKKQAEIIAAHKDERGTGQEARVDPGAT